MLDFRPEVARSDAAGDEIRALLIGRLQKLERMGLARAVGPARWLLAEEAEPSLRELGIRGDIIRTMQRALSAQGQDRSPGDFAIIDATIASEQTIIGRVIEKGLHDELKGSAYLCWTVSMVVRITCGSGVSMGSRRYRKARSSRWNERRAGDRTRP